MASIRDSVVIHLEPACSSFKGNIHLSLIVYLKKNKAFCKASGSLAQSSLASTFLFCFVFLLTSLLFCSYPQDTIVFKLFCCVCIFWVYYCLYSVLAALVIQGFELILSLHLLEVSLEKSVC